MAEADASGRWRAISGPEDVDGDWVAIFRMDDLPPGSKGPEIVVTGITMASYPESEEDDDSEEDEDSGSFGNRTDFEFQLRDAAGKVTGRMSMEDPDEYHHGWESESTEEASDRAMIVVQEFVDDPDYWRWDGSAETRGLWSFMRKPRCWPYR